MKNTLLLLAMIIAGYSTYAQSNTFPSDGNVGIGTTSPTAKLDVNGAIKIETATLSLSTLGWGELDGGVYFDPTTFSGINNLGAPGQIAFRAGNIDGAMVIKTSGNVGIGTTNPGEKLTVTHGSGYGQVVNFTSLLGDEQVGIGVESTGNSWIGTTTNHNFKILANNAAMITVLPNGNVGIGTDNLTNFNLSSASYKLAVAGNVIAEAVTVKLTSTWPDYVFKPTYRLPSLREVRTYIDKNQHLPNMPSAAEVSKNGINLGEIVKLQTKKIEELTLYLIEKEQQIKEIKEAQQSQNEKLQVQQATGQKLQDELKTMQEQLKKLMNQKAKS